MIASVALLVGMWALSRSSFLVEYVYARLLSFQVARVLSLLTGVLPVSLAELVMGGLILYLLVSLAIAAIQVVRRQRSVGNVFASAAIRLVTASLVVLCLFYFLWGLNYARAPLATRLGWPPIERPANEEEARRQTDEIAAFAQQLVEATNQAYREMNGSDDLGKPSEPSGSDHLNAGLDAAYGRVQQRFGLEDGFAARRGRAKPLIASMLMNHLRLGGFYFPWTGEANYNRLMPGPDVPHGVAHEKAHQRGIAREDEANFFGYIASVMSDDASIRYSGYLFGQQQLLGELVRRDLPRARELAALRLKGVQRDITFIRTFWQQYEGRAALMSERVNDTFLRSQGERRGTGAYAASRNLIVIFARQNGGRATVDVKR
jgi:hypothetical protein